VATPGADQRPSSAGYDDPPEVWQTARRLLAAGHERHDVLHMLGSAAAGEIWHLLHERAPYDRDRYARALEALP
jgi:hypothetical protein